MGYQVFRVEKLKTADRVGGRLAHMLRERQPKNANPEKEAENSYYLMTGKNGSREGNDLDAEERLKWAMARFKDILPKKHRSDAVQAIEVVVSASPEVLNNATRNQQDNYLYKTLEWVCEKFGGPKNLVAFSIHRDEKTPHITAILVPTVTRMKNGIEERVLSAKSYIDGPKALSQMQTDLNEAVTKNFGLERGRFNSRARHMDIKKYYGIVNQVARKMELEQELKRDKTNNLQGFER